MNSSSSRPAEFIYRLSLSSFGQSLPLYIATGQQAYMTIVYHQLLLFDKVHIEMSRRYDAWQFLYLRRTGAQRVKRLRPGLLTCTAASKCVDTRALAVINNRFILLKSL